ncbi:MAG TPA: type II/IV secretion system protein [Candidatus Omnitrophica bacterium]|nr:type II/IV secretion system protein [Candidatus Omnitrophota bacterium]
MQEILGILKQKGIIDEADLEKASLVAEQKRENILKVMVEILSDKKNSILEEIARYYRIPYLELDHIKLDKDIVYTLPEDFARRHQIVPLFKIHNWLFVGMGPDLDFSILDEIRHEAKTEVKICVMDSSDVQEGIDRIYRAMSSAEKLVQRMGKIEDLGASIVHLVNLIIAQAVRDRASDIHIEPEPDKLRIRFRIDGVLHEIPSPPKSLESAIVSRIKVLSNLDIAETRLPQDGHFKVNVDGKEIDVRVSTLPTINGENVVLRILDTSNVLLGLEKLGFSEQSLNLFRQAISHPYGMILTTGPTGSGKTTTLYSALMELNTMDRHIVTIEDPVEYRLPLIRQIQVNPKAGLTFANGLRSILRHDPDIIMVGEIRDLETATIAVQSALTGHLVFSTLHTNDAPSAVTRLANMGLEPYLISASVICVMAQRLARRICPRCKTSYVPSGSIIKRFNLYNYVKSGQEIVLYKGEGCDFCKGTGYKDRIGIFEIMMLDEELKEMIVRETSVIELREKARQKGMKILFEDGLEKALQGITTLDEVTRVCEEIAEIKIPRRDISSEVRPYVPEEEKKEEVITSRNIPEGDEIDKYTKKIMNWISRRG